MPAFSLSAAQRTADRRAPCLEAQPRVPRAHLAPRPGADLRRLRQPARRQAQGEHRGRARRGFLRPAGITRDRRGQRAARRAALQPQRARLPRRRVHAQGRGVPQAGRQPAFGAGAATTRGSCVSITCVTFDAMQPRRCLPRRRKSTRKIPHASGVTCRYGAQQKGATCAPFKEVKLTPLPLRELMSHRVSNGNVL